MIKKPKLSTAAVELLAMFDGKFPKSWKIVKESRQTGKQSLKSIERRHRRDETRLTNALRDGHTKIGVRFGFGRGHEPPAPIDQPSRQRSRAALRREGFQRPFEVRCRKKGPRGLRAAKQFALRSGIDIS